MAALTIATKSWEVWIYWSSFSVHPCGHWQWNGGVWIQ